MFAFVFATAPDLAKEAEDQKLKLYLHNNNTYGRTSITAT
jgi:hypothetical protein